LKERRLTRLKKLLIALPLAILIIVLASAGSVMADNSHRDLKGCQAEGETYNIAVGPPGGIDFGPCCIRGHYESSTENGFPGGCCKNNETHNQSPGPPTDPGKGVWSQVGWQCVCPDIHGEE
jgi:hypothetical protein